MSNTILTPAIREELKSLEGSLKVYVAASGLKASATAIGVFFALGFVDADLTFFQNDPIITTPNATYRHLDGLWQIEAKLSTHTTFIAVKSAAEAAALDLYYQAKRDGYIVLSYTKADVEVIATAYVATKKRHLSR